MATPAAVTQAPVWHEGTLGDDLERAGVPRRDLLRLRGRMAAIFAVGSPIPELAAGPASAAPGAERIAEKLSAMKKPRVV